MHSSKWLWVVQLPLDILSFAFVKVAGVRRWQLRRRHLVTSAQGQPQRCRDWKVLLIVFSTGIPRVVRMNRERLSKMRASIALNLLSYGTNQVSRVFVCFVDIDSSVCLVSEELACLSSDLSTDL